ncbi:MAG: beta-ketoacyl synthase N-terminal-like domain-containing protein [Burkholderiaceae bacterium]
MDQPVYLQGRALSSALGADLVSAIALIREQAVPEPGRLLVATDDAWPYYTIPFDECGWYARARALVRAAIAECGASVDRDAPLFVASSSLNVGALENGAPWLPDCLTFVETIADWLAWRGPLAWVSTACTSSPVALLDAAALVRSGAASRAVVLGIELRNRFSCAGFGAMHLLDRHAARPFGAKRGGLVLGEAVAALVVGSAPARWRVKGGANFVDARQPAGAHREVVALAMNAALTDSGLHPRDVDLVNVQATGSLHNDAEEGFALHAVFDQLPPLATLKTAIGHTLGAAGAAELALLTACLEERTWPALPDFEPDPLLGLRCSDHFAPPRHVLATALGFGGGHSCIVLEDTACPA